MPRPTREQLAARRLARQRALRRRRRALVSAGSSLLVAGLVALGLGLASGGAASDAAPPFAAPVMEAGASAGGAPAKLVIARGDGVDIHLPVSTERLTAAGYHPVSDAAAVALEPTGSIDHGDLSRGERTGPPTASLDVGAPAGTTVYAPVDGVIASVSEYTLKGRAEGYEITIAPAAAGGLVVRMNPLQPAAGAEPPRVGEAVVAGESVLGEVRDLAHAGEQQLSELTSDSGNHVNLELVRVEMGALR